MSATQEAPPMSPNGNGDKKEAVEALAAEAATQARNAQGEKAQNKAKAGPPDHEFLSTAVKRLLKAKAETNDEVIGSVDLVDALYLALVSRTHVFAVGPGGVGKTFAAENLGRHIDAPNFYTQFRNDMKREEVFGPLSMQALQQDRYIHVPDGFLPRALVANLDEFADAGKFIRQLLNILNERWFVNGNAREDVPLISASCTTNFWPTEKAFDALMDRLAQRVKVTPVTTKRELKKILKGAVDRDLQKARGEDRTKTYTTLTLEELTMLVQARMLVEVPDRIYELVAELEHNARVKEKLGDISPRRLQDGIRLAQAHRLLNCNDFERVLAGSEQVREDDLQLFCRVLPNNEDDDTFKVCRTLTKDFRDKGARAAEEAQTSLKEVKGILEPFKSRMASGEQLQVAELSDAMLALRQLKDKIDTEVTGLEAEGRDVTDLKAVRAQLKPEEDFLRRVMLGN